MNGIVNFIRGIFLFALFLGATGTLVEATGLVEREAATAYLKGGISFVWLNKQLQENPRSELVHKSTK